MGEKLGTDGTRRKALRRGSSRCDFYRHPAGFSQSSGSFLGALLSLTTGNTSQDNPEQPTPLQKPLGTHSPHRTASQTRPRLCRSSLAEGSSPLPSTSAQAQGPGAGPRVGGVAGGPFRAMSGVGGGGPGRGGLGPWPTVAEAGLVPGPSGQGAVPAATVGCVGRPAHRNPQPSASSTRVAVVPRLSQSHHVTGDRQQRSQQVLCPCAPTPPACWAEGCTDPSLVGWRQCPGGRGWLREHEMLPAGKSQPKAL